VNFENLGARIAENKSLNQKIWALEGFKGKTVFLGGFGVILEFLEWLEGLGTKDRSPTKFGRFFKEFSGFLECLERFRTYS
jgi:hypothetical protein